MISAAAMFTILLVSTWMPIVFTNSGLTIISTFPEVATEIQQLLCPGDVVVSLVQPGVDPHEYQLRVSDIDVIKKADLIVSTGHTWFEHRIRELVERGEVNATLIDLAEIPGLFVTKNPVTNTLNLHLPIRDPLNYVLFIINISETLIRLNPSRSECYMSNAFTVIRDVVNIVLPYKGAFRGEVVIDKPSLQYLVEWMGFRVAWIAKPEEDLEPTPLQIQEMERLFSNGAVSLVLLTYPAMSSESRVLKELAEKHNVALILVDTSGEKGLLELLKDLVSNISRIGLSIKQGEAVTSVNVSQCYSKSLDYVNTALLMLIGIIIGISISIFINMLRGRQR